jgi:hypothetical protein
MTLRKGEDTVETGFYNRLMQEKQKGDRSDRKTRKKTWEANV